MQTLIGTVISTKTALTATVAVRRRFRHPIYKKSLNRTKKFHVHDTKGVLVGDMVKFIPCKPMSKTKKWVITEVVSGPSVNLKKDNDTPVVDVKKKETKVKVAAVKKTVVKKQVTKKTK